MKHIFYIISLSALLMTSCGSYAPIMGNQSGNTQHSGSYSERYIKAYYPMAVEQMEKHGIPASITLAQALLEGGAGRSDLVKNANNHFGVKADSRWQGRTYSKWDNGKWCKFRVYKNTEESYEDHSAFLTSNSRYDFLFKLRKSDYVGWAKGLKKAGYAEDPQYPTKLINLIEKYGLDKYDSFSRADIKKVAQKNGMSLGCHDFHKANGLVYTLAVEGDTFESLSAEFDISKRKLRRYNDLYKGYIIKAGDIIYIEKKNNRARRGNRFHTLQTGESLHSISQKYGVKLQKVYKMNPMYKEYAKPKVGDIIKLR